MTKVLPRFCDEARLSPRWWSALNHTMENINWVDLREMHLSGATFHCLELGVVELTAKGVETLMCHLSYSVYPAISENAYRLSIKLTGVVTSDIINPA